MSDSLLIPFLDVYVTWSLIAFLPLVHLELLTVLKCGIEHRETNLCLLSWETISLHFIDTLKELTKSLRSVIYRDSRKWRESMKASDTCVMLV